MLALQIRDSRVGSYTDYYEEKMAERRICHSWRPSLPRSNGSAASPTDHLPTELQDTPKGSEISVVKPVREKILAEGNLNADLTNGYEMDYMGLEKPGIAFFPPGISKPSAGDYITFGDHKGNGWARITPAVGANYAV